MKCVRNNIDNSIKRVRDDMAVDMVISGKWKFCSKKEWKEEVRSKIVIPVPEPSLVSVGPDAIPEEAKKSRAEKKRLANEKRKERTNN